MREQPKDCVLYVRMGDELMGALDRFVSESKIPEMTKARAVRMLLAKALKLPS